MKIDWQHVQVRLKVAGKYLSQKGLTVDPTWRFWMFDQTLWYVWTGRATMELPQGRVNLTPGTCLWLRPGFEYRHRQDPDRPLGMYAVHFELLTADGRPRPNDAPLPPELLSPPSATYVEKTLDRLAGANPEGIIWSSAMTPAHRRLTTCLLTSLLMELDATAGDAPTAEHREPPNIAHINEIARRIEADPTQFHTVADMARELRYSEGYFSRLFYRVRSISAQKALIASRLRHAAHMLLETDLPIKEIAKRLGYHDKCAFAHQFRDYLSMTPGQYRKKTGEAMHRPVEPYVARGSRDRRRRPSAENPGRK